MSKPLAYKTIRPGSLNNYNYYHSGTPAVSAPVRRTPRSKHSPKKFLLIFLAVFSVYFVFQQFSKSNQAADSPTVKTVAKTSTSGTKFTKKPVSLASTIKVTQCSGNKLDKFILIDISSRKMWACEGEKRVYQASVITGMEMYKATETPEGTYKILSKHKDTVLTGSDETGSWRDPVDYWMPFHENKYGTYGFHDASWRNPSEFGAIDAMTSKKASHGCVELPSEASKWLYDWAPVGTTLTIKA